MVSDCRQCLYPQVPCFVLLVSLTPMVVGQVDHSIDQDEDLLAVDSIDNEVDTAVAVYLRHVIIGFYFMSHSSVPSSPLPPYLPR